MGQEKIVYLFIVGVRVGEEEGGSFVWGWGRGRTRMEEEEFFFFF